MIEYTGHDVREFFRNTGSARSSFFVCYCMLAFLQNQERFCNPIHAQIQTTSRLNPGSRSFNSCLSHFRVRQHVAASLVIITICACNRAPQRLPDLIDSTFPLAKPVSQQKPLYLPPSAYLHLLRLNNLDEHSMTRSLSRSLELNSPMSSIY